MFKEKPVEYKIKQLEKVCLELEDSKKTIHYTIFNNLENYMIFSGINDFFSFLLYKSKEYFENGKSISANQIIPIETKLLYFDNAINKINLQETADNIFALSSGWKRYYIHSRRFQIDDFDLAFLYFYIKLISNGFKQYSGQFSLLLCFYCAEGTNYSYKLSKSSIPRIRDIIDYIRATT